MRILRRLTLPDFALAWLLVCGVSDSLAAEMIDRSIGQFVHTAWSVKDGAPGGVWALAQTRDGYLTSGFQLARSLLGRSRSLEAHSSTRLQNLGTERISSTRKSSSSRVRVNVTLALRRACEEKR